MKKKVAVREPAPETHYRRRTTDADGLATFELDPPGAWIVHLAHMATPADGAGPPALLTSSMALVAGPAD